MRINAKPKYTQNYIRINSIHPPVFHRNGNTLTAIQPVASEDTANLPPAPQAVVIPNEITSIANNAFRGLGSLKNICFGHTSYQLGSGVFSGCTALESAVLGEGFEKVPLQTFADCPKLQLVRLPRSVRRINMDAFKNCDALKGITLPPELEIIEVSAFWGCRSLEEIDLPDSVTKLGAEAFANCIGLKKVRLSAALEEIGSCAFQNCISLEEIVIPEGIKALPMGVFAGCRKLRHIVLPSTLEYISPYAFYRCDGLEFVECVHAERFEQALECTPFWQKNRMDPHKPHRFPMELLNHFAGEVPGTMLCAMGHSIFDIDKKYQFFLSDYPGAIRVRSRWLNTEYPAGADYDEFLINDAFQPIPDIRPLIDAKDCVSVF